MGNLIISVTTYNRSKIAMQSISDLITKVKMKFPIFIQDDASTELGINTQMLIFHNQIMNFYLNRNEQNIGCELNNINRLDFIINSLQNLGKHIEFINDCFVYLTDDDMLYSNHFLIQLKRLLVILENDSSILAGTLFNVNNHTVIEEYKFSGILQTYLIKQSFGGCSVLIRIKDFIDAIQFYESQEYKNYGALPGWDWALCTYARKEKKILISTQNSYVQHIGVNGVNSKTNKYDSADNYID